MYDGNIEWQESYDDNGGISGWHVVSDAGASYTIGVAFRNFAAKLGDSRGYSFTQPVSSIDDMPAVIDDVCRNSIPICGAPPGSYPVPTQIYDPYFDFEEQAWAYDTDTPWRFFFKEGFIVGRTYDHVHEILGKEVFQFEQAENIVRNDWDTFYL